MATISRFKYSSILGVFLVLLFFGSPNLILAVQNISAGDYYTSLLDLFHFIITCGLFLLPVVLFNLEVRRYFLIVSPIFLLVPVFIFIAILFHKLPTRSMFYVLLEAERLEIVEFLSGTLFWKFLILLFPVFIILISVKLIPSNTKLATSIRVLFVGFYLTLYIVTFGYKIIQRKTFKSIAKVSYWTFMRDSPINLTRRFYKAFKMYEKDKLVNFNKKALGVFREKEIYSREIYILVLGESSRYKNWGINGYYRNTSPKLQEIDNIISYKNIISPSHSTNKSVPIILTTRNAQNFYTEIDYTSIINVFKKVGFSTYWLGNQPTKGNVIGSIAKDSHEISESNYHKTDPFDGNLLEQVKAILGKNEQKTFIIIHTWGSHYPYQKRYPEAFSIFNPTMRKNQHICLKSKHKNAMINSYDNSIIYTDYFLSSLIDIINIDSAISNLAYISDHGENLFDDEKIGFGRGFGKDSPQLFHVPLFFWGSDKYISNNRLKWETLICNDSINCTTEGLIYTFTDLAGIRWNNFDSTKSFANNYYEQTNRYFLDKENLNDFDNYFMQEKN